MTNSLVCIIIFTQIEQTLRGKNEDWLTAILNCNFDLLNAIFMMGNIFFQTQHTLIMIKNHAAPNNNCLLLKPISRALFRNQDQIFLNKIINCYCFFSRKYHLSNCNKINIYRSIKLYVYILVKLTCDFQCLKPLVMQALTGNHVKRALIIS